MVNLIWKNQVLYRLIYILNFLNNVLKNILTKMSAHSEKRELR